MVLPSIGVQSLPGGRRGGRRGSVCCGSDRAGRLLAPVCGETERKAESYSGWTAIRPSSRGPLCPPLPAPLLLLCTGQLWGRGCVCGKTGIW